MHTALPYFRQETSMLLYLDVIHDFKKEVSEARYFTKGKRVLATSNTVLLILVFDFVKHQRD